MNGGFARFTAMTVEEVAAEIPVTLAAGLTPAEASERLKQFGRNELASGHLRVWRIVFRQFRSSFVLLLLAAGLISYVLGEKLDGVIIYGFVVLNAVISFFQEYRSEQMVSLLKQYMKPTSRVRRGGKVLTIDRAEIVPGDMVLLEAGDMIPADLRFTEVENVIVDESALTGESITVSKSVEAGKEQVHEPYRAGNIGFFGTVILSGRAEGVVFTTGGRTVIGDVATLATSIKRQSGFAKEINRFSRFILYVILLTLAALFLAQWLTGAAVSVSQLLVFSIALAVSVVPEALPVVTTFSLSHGALRLARKKVVVKRLSSIEDLGGIEVLCTDKTGTLTENRLEVKDVFGKEKKSVLFYAGLAARSKDAFDLAVGAKKADVLFEIPFDPERRRNSVLVTGASCNELVVRGAPESVLSAVALTADERAEVETWIKTQGQSGARTLAIAKKTIVASRYQASDESHGLEFVGVIAFVDPIKPSTKTAILDAARLGIKIKVITGDSLEVAGAVAHQIGLIDRPDAVITGTMLSAMSALEKQTAVEAHHVFARVSPRQKYEIIQLLQTKYRVGFLGEGINDAPALKVADVGLVVQSASDIAREAADIVLLERNLQVVVDGIMEGRIVFANTLKYIKTTLASNFGHFYAIAIASLFIDFLPLLPLQILLINLLTDVPMIVIATDATDRGEVMRPERYHLKDLALFTTGIGLVSTVFDLVFFAVFLPMGKEILQTTWFVGSIISEVIILYSLRTRLPFFRAARPSRIMLLLTGVSAVVGLIIPFTSIGIHLFNFIPLTPILIGLTVLIAGADFVFTEISKLAYYRFASRTK